MSLAPSEAVRNPRVGMLAIVRKRRGVISEVRPYSADVEGVLHLVRIDYKDDGYPDSEELLWEREPNKRLLEPNEIPNSSDPPMDDQDFDALIRSARWTAMSPYIDPDGDGPLDRMPICSPFYGAVQVEDYQMVPLLKALQMPRINMMIADDVGLGKTVEAGLIMRELLIRRRIQRVLILTPASLRVQWKDEMWDKFSLRFDVIDRGSTQKLRRSMGIDANPWRSTARAIASYHYLKQPDILEQFHSACRVPEDSPHLPWDLLIVDEVHNLMPSAFGEDSDLCKTLRYIAPHFEHRIFLTATPHNGRTRSFSGLLELLDPVRFSQTDELKPAEKDRIRQVVVRRLKREINERTDPPKFCHRLEPKALKIEFDKKELALITALDEFRDQIRKLIASGEKRRRISGTFAIEILGKRLLSGPVTFAESWRRCKLGLIEEEAADDGDVIAAKKTVEEETADDRENEKRQSTASVVIGSWLKDIADDLEPEIASLDKAVAGLGLKLDKDNVIEQTPKADGRFEELLQLIKDNLLDGESWRNDERIVIFTEYKTTLDYLLRRLRAECPDSEDRILCLFGGMNDIEREQIKEAFNDPEASVRILIGTDAASEGLNLQETARFLLHYDCPWNPSRIEQRNGRLDRHGQARDVQTYHFVSNASADMRFISHLITKVDQIREDLGGVGDILDEAMHRRLIMGESLDDVQKDLDLNIEAAKNSTELDADDSVSIGEGGDGQTLKVLDALADEIDLDSDSQQSLLDSAMSIHAGRPQIDGPDDSGLCKIINPSLSGWSDTIDETVRRSATGSAKGQLPFLSFDAQPFLQDINGRIVFRPRSEVQMMHLGHPVMGKAISSLGRRRFPGPNAVSRWAARFGDVPQGCDALILLHVEELGVNELRETFHHWIRTYCYPVNNGEIDKPLSHQPAIELRPYEPARDKTARSAAEDLLADVEVDLKDEVKRIRKKLTDDLKKLLDTDGKKAVDEENKSFASRQGEVSALIATNVLEKLNKEIVKLQQLKGQGTLFDQESHLDELDRDIKLKEEEIKRRKEHYEEVRRQLTKERDRIINRMLPKRYALHGEAQVFPLAVEVRLRRK